MFNARKEWMAEISLLDEYFGKKPRYPLTAMQVFAKKRFDEQNKILKEIPKDLAASISEATKAISGSIEDGFNNLIQTNQQGFDDLSNKLDEISSILGWGFEKLIEQQQITNMLLANVSELLRIPDSQKQRQYYIEQGLKHFVNARFNKDLYNDALDFFLLAEKIEKTDYFLFQKIGIVYLFSPEHLDFNKAYEYFDKSVKYAYPESFLKSKQTKNVLSLNTSIDFKEQMNSYLDIKEIAAKSLLLGARALYFLKDYKKAINNIDKALTLNPKNSAQYFYDKALYESLVGNNKNLISALKKSIELEPIYAEVVLQDKKIKKTKSITDLLIRVSDEKYREFDTLINNIQYTFSSNSIFSNKIKEIKELHNKKTFAASVNGIKLLTQKIDISDNNLKKIASKEYNIRPVMENIEKLTSNNELKLIINDLIKRFSLFSNFLLGNNNESFNFIDVFYYENIINKLNIDGPKLIDSYWKYNRNHWKLKNRIWNIFLSIFGIIPLLFIFYLLFIVHSIWSILGGLILLVIIVIQWSDWGIFDAMDYSINYNKYKEVVDNSNDIKINLEKKILEYIS